jgi:prevent-host-death family protein
MLMTEIVEIHQAKRSFFRLVERALAGEEVVTARNGEPLVRLVPLLEREPHVPGRSRGTDLDRARFRHHDRGATQGMGRALSTAAA